MFSALCTALIDSVDGKTVKQPSATSADQVFLAAAAAAMGRVPGNVTAASAVEMANLDRSFCGTAAVIAASVVGAIGKGAAIGLGTGQDVVLVGGVPRTFDGFILFRQNRCATQVVAEASRIQVIAMKIGNILGDNRAPGVVPRTLADSVTGIYGWFSFLRLGAQVGMPCFFATNGFGQLLAMFVCSFKTT